MKTCKIFKLKNDTEACTTEGCHRQATEYKSLNFKDFVINPDMVIPKDTNVTLLWHCDYYHPEQRYRSAWCQIDGKKINERVNILIEHLTEEIGTTEVEL